MFLLRKRKVFNYLIPSGRATEHAWNPRVTQTDSTPRKIFTGPSAMSATTVAQSTTVVWSGTWAPDDDYRILTVTSARIQLRFLAATNSVVSNRGFGLQIMQIKETFEIVSCFLFLLLSVHIM